MGLGRGGALLASIRVLLRSLSLGGTKSTMTGEISGLPWLGSGRCSYGPSKSNIRARFSLELEIDFCNEGNEGDGRVGERSEMGEEAY
jgi:hypothetical protein